MEAHNSNKKLYKSNKKIVCGVCAGIAEYFDIAPTLIRLAIAIISLSSLGTGLLAYIVAAIIIQEEPTITN